MIPLELRVPAGLARRRRAPAADRTATPPAPSRKEASAERRARRLALAYWIERAIDEGRLQDYAHAARVLGVSRARITQVMDMPLLPVAEQEAILAQPAAGGESRGEGDSVAPTGVEVCSRSTRGQRGKSGPAGGAQVADVAAADGGRGSSGGGGGGCGWGIWSGGDRERSLPRVRRRVVDRSWTGHSQQDVAEAVDSSSSCAKSATAHPRGPSHLPMEVPLVRKKRGTTMSTIMDHEPPILIKQATPKVDDGTRVDQPTDDDLPPCPVHTVSTDGRPIDTRITEVKRETTDDS